MFRGGVYRGLVGFTGVSWGSGKRVYVELRCGRRVLMSEC